MMFHCNSDIMYVPCSLLQVLLMFDEYADIEEETNEEETNGEETNQARKYMVNAKLANIFERIKKTISDRISHDFKGYEKAAKMLEKHVDNLPKSNDAALQKAFCTFGETVTQACQCINGKKGAINS